MANKKQKSQALAISSSRFQRRRTTVHEYSALLERSLTGIMMDHKIARLTNQEVPSRSAVSNKKMKNESFLQAATKNNNNASPSPPKYPAKCSMLASIYPVHPLLLFLACTTLLPTFLYLNRGYTVWFHLMSIAYALTRQPFLRRFLIIQGTGITLGWYAAIYNDLHLHGRFCHILYMNMPSVMKNIMVDTVENGGDGGILYTTEAMVVMAISHALDTLLHPGLVYMFWRGHIASGKSIKDIFTWDAIVATYGFSRLWSIVHTYYNSGEIGLWYCGYDVFHIHDLDSWVPAYVAESMFYVGIVSYKVWAAWRERATSIRQQQKSL